MSYLTLHLIDSKSLMAIDITSPVEDYDLQEIGEAS